MAAKEASGFQSRKVNHLMVLMVHTPKSYKPKCYTMVIYAKITVARNQSEV